LEPLEKRHGEETKGNKIDISEQGGQKKKKKKKTKKKQRKMVLLGGRAVQTNPWVT